MTKLIAHGWAPPTKTLADLFEVSLATIGNWLANIPTSRRPCRRAATSPTHKAKDFTHADVKVLAIAGEVQEVPYNRYLPPDTQAAIFWLRNRRRKQWREVIEHEHTISDEKPKELEEAGIRARNAYRR